MTRSCALMLALMTTTAHAQSTQLNVYNWSDYIADSTVPDFQSETGISVNYDVFDANEVLEAKLLTGSTGYDVVVPSVEFMARQIQAGVFMPIDKDKLSNYANLDPQLLAALETNDPGNTYGVPYLMFSTGLGYDIDKVGARIDAEKIGSWDMVFDPELSAKLADCGIAVLDSPTEVVAAALNYLELDPSSEDQGDLDRAMELLGGLRPHLRYFNSSQYLSDLANGEVCVVIGYSGDVLQARDRADEAGQGIRIAYSIPPEGAQLGFDMLAIPADAPNPDNALAFIDHLLRPEVAAALTNAVYYANPNMAATPLVDPEVAGDPGIYPADAVRAKLFTLRPHTPRYDRLLTRAWTTLKTGR
ncbi:MAG: polyamine ABC transporter substrate-binding protein [Paracoccus sp. (in: a-proteobacteria)]|uniref:polyamine ABC transporter substrate-binding protein n=1 Tax=Paracoccus sp. TaxID=267 RepID=UPI00391AB543